MAAARNHAEKKCRSKALPGPVLVEKPPPRKSALGASRPEASPYHTHGFVSIHRAPLGAGLAEWKTRPAAVEAHQSMRPLPTHLQERHDHETQSKVTKWSCQPPPLRKARRLFRESPGKQ